MAHIKRFEEFRKENNSINELFKSKEKAADKEAAKDAFEDKLKELEGKGYTTDVDYLTKQAEDNKYRGTLKPVKSRKSGKVMVIYKDGLTNLQKFASGSGGAISNEDVDFEEEETEEYDENTFDDVDENVDFEEETEEEETEEDEFDLTEYDNVQELFGSKEKKAEKEKAEKEIKSKIEKGIEDGYKGDLSKLMATAKKNKFRGKISLMKDNNPKSGHKGMILYKAGTSNLQKLASGSGGLTRGE